MMMSEQLSTTHPITTLTGVVLAGGEARRMGGRDKGLIPFLGQPLVSYALNALSQIAGTVMINANRHCEDYARWGYPVISDGSAHYDGPLAGMLASLRAAKTPHLLVVPCDCPLMRPALLRRLYDTLLAERAEACVAHDGVWLNPVFAVLDCGIADSLQAYMARGERKIDLWLKQHKLAIVDFSADPDLFRNANTPEELAALEKLVVSHK